MVCYPESVPENWIEIIRLSGAKAAISPLHDADIASDGRGEKKAHWHVILVYPGPKSFASVREFCASFGGTTPQALENVKGYYRYLTHKDDPDKAQYDEAQIITLNGFTILDYSEMTRAEVLGIKMRLIRLVQDHGFIEYSSLVDHLMANGTAEELDVATGHTIFFTAYLTSRRHMATSDKSTLRDRLADASPDPSTPG